jgi:hypothetical protein
VQRLPLDVRVCHATESVGSEIRVRDSVETLKA